MSDPESAARSYGWRATRGGSAPSHARGDEPLAPAGLEPTGSPGVMRPSLMRPSLTRLGPAHDSYLVSLRLEDIAAGPIRWLPKRSAGADHGVRKIVRICQSVVTHVHTCSQTHSKDSETCSFPGISMRLVGQLSNPSPRLTAILGASQDIESERPESQLPVPRAGGRRTKFDTRRFGVPRAIEVTPACPKIIESPPANHSGGCASHKRHSPTAGQDCVPLGTACRTGFRSSSSCLCLLSSSRATSWSPGDFSISCMRTSLTRRAKSAKAASL